MARLDMIHIDRSQRAESFNKVVAAGQTPLAQGIWVIMFPEGTRIPRGQTRHLQIGRAPAWPSRPGAPGHSGGRDSAPSAGRAKPSSRRRAGVDVSIGAAHSSSEGR